MTDWRKHPVKSTYISDPYAKFRVVSSSTNYGSGIQGFYYSRQEAEEMESFFKQRGDSDIAIENYDPKEMTTGGIHPLVEKAMKRRRNQ